MARAGGSPSPQVAAMNTSRFAFVSSASSRSAMSIKVGFRPFLRAALARSLASFSQLPDSLA